jgi:hypothetical protein
MSAVPATEVRSLPIGTRPDLFDMDRALLAQSKRVREAFGVQLLVDPTDTPSPSATSKAAFSGKTVK